MPTLPPCLVDARAFSRPVTVTLNAHYHRTEPDGGSTTITGSAMFTWNRVNLASRVQNKKLLYAGFVDGPPGNLPDVGRQEYLAVQSGVGQMPGWAVVFGEPDPDAGTGAFTQTYNPPPGDGHPTTTSTNVSCELSMFCAQVAPGRYRYTAAFQSGGDRDDGTVAVELLQAGTAATPTAAAVGNLYRLTFPVGADQYHNYSFKLTYNGQSIDLAYAPPGGYFGAFNDGYAPPLSQVVRSDTLQPFCTAFPRSPSVVEVLMNTYGDTLAGGAFSYLDSRRFQPVDSTVTVTANGANGTTMTLPDPFHLSSVSHTGNPADLNDYCDIEVSF